MKYLSLSPSILNDFQHLRSGLMEKWGKTPQDYLESITAGWEPNDYTSRGSAYNALLEHGPEKYRVQLKGDVFYLVHEPELGKDWEFSEAEVQPVIDFRTAHPNAVYEVWGRLDFMFGSLPVRMNMRLDAMDALSAFEFKTSKSAKSYSDRMDSLQWKCYMLAFPDLQDITYCEYQFMKRDKTVRAKYNTFYRPQGLRQEVETAVEDCVAWLMNFPSVIQHRMREKT